MHKVIDKSPQKAEIAMGVAPIVQKIKPYPRRGAPIE
jgi:hypothetical protein